MWHVPMIWIMIAYRLARRLLVKVADFALVMGTLLPGQDETALFMIDAGGGKIGEDTLAEEGR